MDSGKVVRFCLVGLPAGLFLLGAASVVYTQLMDSPLSKDDTDEKKQATAGAILRKEVNQAELERYLRVLSEDIGERHMGKYDALKTTALFIESSMGPSNMGYVVNRQTYEIGLNKVWNLKAELRGGKSPDDIIVVGAHYDTVPNCPGANDNGTGVAALLALANSFSGMAGEFDRTIQFVAFVNEEPPYFQTPDMGSVRYAELMNQRRINIEAMVSLETIGFFSDEANSQSYPPELAGRFPATGNFLGFVGNEQSKAIIEKARTAFMAGCDIPAIAAAMPESVQGAGWSDHWSFWQQGYPAFMVTDTAPFRYPHYHEPTDTIDKIDLAKFTEVVRGMRAAIIALATE